MQQIVIDRLLEMAGDPRWQLNISVALALEDEAVGKGPSTTSWTYFLCERSEHQAVHFRLRPELSGPGDEFVLELALVARCDFIVTHNVRDLRAAERFGIRVVTPGEFLRTMGVEP